MKVKFQIQELLGIGLTLVVLGIGLSYGIEVMSDIRDDAADNAGTSTTATNEVITNASTAQKLALDCTSGISCSAVMNTSGGFEYGTDNFSCSGESITLNMTGVVDEASTLYVNYSCLTSRAEYNASVDAITSVAKIPSKMTTIATVVIAAVIIGVLVTYLWGRFN